MTQHTQATRAPHSVSVYDARPFFEKALVFGVQNGILDADKLESIRNDAPKGMVQIARYFGNENLRPDLEKAKDRIVNLVSLYLESTTGGDVRQAAESLRDHSFLSRSKGGSDMLKAMIAMPQNSHFGMSERGAFSDDHIPLLAKWSLRSLPDYQAELAKRKSVGQVIDAAIWMADALGMDVSELEDAGKDAEAVIRTGLLVFALKRTEMPDWLAFEKMVASLRKKPRSASSLTLPENLPAQLAAAVESVRQSVLADMPRILDAALPVRKLFNQTPAFMGRYFWDEDTLSEVDDYDRSASQAWTKITGGHSDDSSLLTLFVCVASSAAPKTVLSEKGAATLVRKMRKSGFSRDLAEQYIAEHAPEQHQDDYMRMWQDFCEEARPTLLSGFDYTLADALALLRRECNIEK